MHPSQEIFRLKDAAEYLGIKGSYLYQLTHGKKIPFTKPGGKLIYFRKSDLDDYLNRNRVDDDTLQMKAANRNYLNRRRVS